MYPFVPTGLEADIIFSCGQCNFQTLNRGSYLSHTSEHENVNGNIRKPTRSVNPKPDVPTGTNDYFGETNRIDLVGPIISERVVETIVDLSGAHSLLEVSVKAKHRFENLCRTRYRNEVFSCSKTSTTMWKGSRVTSTEPKSSSLKILE